MWPPLLLGDSGGSLESAAEEYAVQVPKDYVVLGCKQGRLVARTLLWNQEVAPQQLWSLLQVSS